MPTFPADFRVQEISTNGVTIHVRSGGQGLAVVLLHGLGDTSDVWAEMASDLARDHTVVVPDLRGIGPLLEPRQADDAGPRARRGQVFRRHDCRGDARRRRERSGRRRPGLRPNPTATVALVRAFLEAKT